MLDEVQRGQNQDDHDRQSWYSYSAKGHDPDTFAFSCKENQFPDEQSQSQEDVRHFSLQHHFSQSHVRLYLEVHNLTFLAALERNGFRFPPERATPS